MIDLEQTTEFVRYLDDLRASGRTNMFGAGPYLRETFGLTEPEAYKVLSAWMSADIDDTIDKRAASIFAAVSAGERP